jgi:hypothetical protein
LFFDADVIDFLVIESNKYAIFKNEPNPSIAPEEMKAFIAILPLSGYIQLPEKRAFWEEAPDVHNFLASNAMRRNRFLEISRFLHCADNSASPLIDNDKF